MSKNLNTVCQGNPCFQRIYTPGEYCPQLPTKLKHRCSEKWDENQAL